jgi:hypothetical protein
MVYQTEQASTRTIVKKDGLQLEASCQGVNLIKYISGIVRFM